MTSALWSKQEKAARFVLGRADLMLVATADIRYLIDGAVNPAWRAIADAVRAEGIYSAKTGTIDIAVREIVRRALALSETYQQETGSGNGTALRVKP